MDTVKLLWDSLDMILHMLWSLLLAMWPLLVPIIVIAIIKALIGRGVHWASLVTGDSRRVARRKSKAAKNAVDFVSGISDLTKKK